MISHKKSLPCYFILASFYLFLYLPLALLVIYSFNSTPITTPLSSFTFHWYKELFHNSQIWIAFSNSIIVAITSTILSLFFTSLLIYYKTIGGHTKGLVPLFYGNLLIPDTMLGIALLSFFSRMDISLGYTTIIVSHTVLGLGLTIPLMFLRFKDLPPTLLEASAVLGASSWTTFRRIVMPFMMPTLLATSLVVFILSFDDYILTYFCAGSSVQTLSLFLVASLRYGISPVMNALTTVVMLFTICIITLLFLLKRKEEVEAC